MPGNPAHANMPLKISILVIFLTLITLSGCQQLSKQDSYPDSLPTPETPYQRKDWPHWIDADKDCQNTRQELLIASSRIPVTFKNAKRCTVKTGLWIGPYTGRKFTTASDVDIDHIVPLAHAHRHGAAKWTRALRRTFANDFDNLLVVDDATNQAKSDKAPHEWLPPNKDFWCEYGRRWQHVKDKYGLIYSKAERRALKLMAETCFR
ncbi:MAG: HNH endonuclease family protein [Nitrosomonas sp.]|nr:HNH endonuclease family protein [Nitrosomonas sp.]